LVKKVLDYLVKTKEVKLEKHYYKYYKWKKQPLEKFQWLFFYKIILWWIFLKLKNIV
jgi:hypothetical protein